MNGTLAHAELMWCYGRIAWFIEWGYPVGKRWIDHELEGDISTPLTSFADRSRYYTRDGKTYAGKERNGLRMHDLFELGVLSLDPKSPQVSEVHNWLTITGFNEGHSFR